MKLTNALYLRITLAIVSLSFIFLAGCPAYNVYVASQHGKAELARATMNRQIKVQEAEATQAAAYALASADTIRAVGVARANKIIGQSLINNGAYLTYLWLQTLEATAGKGQTIYVPTSNGSGGPGVFPSMGLQSLPITEASRTMLSHENDGGSQQDKP